MGYTRYTCKSTSTTMIIDANSPKEAAQEFVDELMQGLYKVKIKKCSVLAMRKFPDTTIVVTEAGGSGKEIYFQYTSMMPKY